MGAAAGAEVSSTILSDGVTLIQGKRGWARLSWLAPGVVLYVCGGYFTTAFAEPMIGFADRELRRNGKLVMVTDAWELGSVDAEYREAWTEWFKRHKHDFRMELLVRSKLMEMAASLANLFTGIAVVSTHSNVDAWERAAARSVPGFRRPTSAA